MNRIIDADHSDSIRITKSNGQRVQIPVAAVLAVDRVLRKIHLATKSREEPMDITPVVITDIKGKKFIAWFASAMDAEGQGKTPWAAVTDLAKKLEERTT